MIDVLKLKSTPTVSLRMESPQSTDLQPFVTSNGHVFFENKNLVVLIVSKNQFLLENSTNQPKELDISLLAIHKTVSKSHLVVISRSGKTRLTMSLIWETTITHLTAIKSYMFVNLKKTNWLHAVEFLFNKVQTSIILMEC